MKIEAVQQGVKKVDCDRYGLPVASSLSKDYNLRLFHGGWSLVLGYSLRYG
jgi:hypothetical protein